MTTIASSVRSTTDPVDDVRRVLVADAVLCATSGAVLVAAARPLADLAGVDPAWPLAAAGAFLLALAVGLAVLARSSSRRVLALTPWSAEGDLLWAVGSFAVAAGVSLTGPGRALIAAQGLVVAGMALLKTRAVRAAR